MKQAQNEDYSLLNVEEGNSTDVEFHASLRKLEVNSSIIIVFNYTGSLNISLHSKNTSEFKEVIHLLISIRPDEDVIVFNSQVNSKWDYEERRRHPFVLNRMQRLEIQIKENGFLVTIGDGWIKHYIYRHNINNIEQLTIRSGRGSLRLVEEKYPNGEDEKENKIEPTESLTE